MAFGSGSALGFTPSYSMHPLIAKVTGVSWINGSRREDFTLDYDSALAQIQREKPALTFITTPNNPTGSSLSIDEIEKLAKATEELASITDSIRREGELERDKIIAAAKELAIKIEQEADNKASGVVAKARAELREEAASLAVELAEDMLKKQVSADDQKRLVDEYMQKVGELH